MTRKDYVAIGSVLAGSFACATDAEKSIVWRSTLSIADVFAADNPRFDRARFYTFVLGNPDPFVTRPC